MIRRTLPSRSPTVGFIWTMAMRKVRITFSSMPQFNSMILKETSQRGRRERRSRGVLFIVRRAAEATENKAGRLFQYHADKKKRPQILGRTEDVIVREQIRLIWRLRCLRMCGGG